MGGLPRIGLGCEAWGRTWLGMTPRSSMRGGRYGEGTGAGAEALLMRAAPLACDDAAFYNLAGLLWEARGDERAAKKFYGRAIRRDRKYPPAQQNMRRLYELRTFGHTRQCVALGDELGFRGS